MDSTSTQAYREQFAQDGFCLIKSVLTPEVAARLLSDIAEDIHRVGTDKFLGQTSIHSNPGIEVYSHDYKLLNSFQWGLTGMIRDITGANLLPGFAYFQVYRKDNHLFVHSDRASCEYSMSLTLAYSDGLPWDLTVSDEIVDHDAPEEGKKVARDHGSAKFHRLRMDPGDGVLYPGYGRRHGRLEPNPNRWSAHIFLHWVDADSPHAKYAFDEKERDTTVDFNIPKV